MTVKKPPTRKKTGGRKKGTPNKSILKQILGRVRRHYGGATKEGQKTGYEPAAEMIAVRDEAKELGATAPPSAAWRYLDLAYKIDKSILDKIYSDAPTDKSSSTEKLESHESFLKQLIEQEENESNE